MLAAGIQSPVPLDELESHLRDDIARQIKSGLDEAEAFHAAIQKLGHAALLNKEFKLAQAPANARARKLLIAFIGFLLVSSFMLVLPLFKTGNFSEMDFSQQISGIAAAMTAVLLGYSGWLSRGFSGLFQQTRQSRRHHFRHGVVDALEHRFSLGDRAPL